MKKTHFVVGVHITDRVQRVPEVQRVLTEFGCYIKARLGLHETHETYCSPGGMLLIDMLYDETASRQFVEKLRAIEGVEVQTMEFAHDE